jgi:hypothetical protein
MAKFLVLLLFCYSLGGFSQNLEYTKSIIDTLTSNYFGGRGAVNNGELKAAKYLQNEFRRNHLSSFDSSFFQTFEYPINTFPGEMSVTLDGNKLVPGKDFIVDPSSGAIGGTYDIVWYYKGNVPSKKEFKKLVIRNFFANKIIVIDDLDTEDNKEIFELLKLNVFGAAGIIHLEDKKLTQSLSKTYFDFGILRIMREKISRKSRKIEIEIDQKFVRKQPSQNVIGFIKGEEFPDSIIILSAHYDHLGFMGSETYFPGANDNASGIALLLNLAYHYAHKEPPKKTIVFMLFGAEEAGILGSKYFVENPMFNLSRINFVLNMDIMGTGNEGAMIVNGSVHPDQFKLINRINQENDYLQQIKSRGKAANSDHYWFSEKGIPAFFIYTLGGISAYHDINDRAETLPLTEFEDCFRLLRDFIDEL